MAFSLIIATLVLVSIGVGITDGGVLPTPSDILLTKVPVVLGQATLVWEDAAAQYRW